MSSLLPASSRFQKLMWTQKLFAKFPCMETCRHHLCKDAKAATTAGPPLPCPHCVPPRREKGDRAIAGSCPSVAGRLFPHGCAIMGQMHGAALSSSSHPQKELLPWAILSGALVTSGYDVCLCVLEQWTTQIRWPLGSLSRTAPCGGC